MLEVVTSPYQFTLKEDFWNQIPGYSEVSEQDFSNPAWQERNSIMRAEKLRDLLQDVVAQSFIVDLAEGLSLSTMSMRMTPYIFSLIDWNAAQKDPIRRQFMPLKSEMLASHPLLKLDSLNEHGDEIAQGVVHRYPDRALFLTTDKCPVYCRFCTRSYSVGVDTPMVEKDRNAPIVDRWKTALDSIRESSAIVDVVVSGGDSFRLKASQLLELGTELINMGKLKRIRFASKGLSVLPMKIIKDCDWTEALIRLSDMGRAKGVEVSFHTHINHPREMTHYVEEAAKLLFTNGVMVRNQSVLLRGVNDGVAEMTQLVKALGDNHIHPYYTYVCDLVSGIEDMRTSIDTACHLEKHVRGQTAGYNTPLFVVDAPGGGGKRDVHSYEIYDKEVGLAVYTAPSVRPGKFFVYPDPLHSLSPKIASDWAVEERAQEMLQMVIERARMQVRRTQ